MFFDPGMFDKKDTKKIIPRARKLPYGPVGIGAGLGYLGGYGSGLVLNQYYPKASRISPVFPLIGVAGGGYLGYLLDKHSSRKESSLTDFINLGKKLHY